VSQIFSRLFLLFTLLALCSCDRLREPESREIAAGYRLKRVRGSNGLALIIPHESGGQIIDEIGWQKPIIVARGSGSYYWEVINTDHAEHTRVSDEKRKTDQAYQSINVMSAEQAWAQLNPDGKVW
jgi:hypothetical protein